MTFLLLVGAHFFFDFGGQGDYMARAKAPRGAPEWPWALFGHGAIHGAAVALITGSTVLGCFEWFLHSWIDAAKCEGAISYHADQALHLLCKVAWALALAYLLT